MYLVLPLDVVVDITGLHFIIVERVQMNTQSVGGGLLLRKLQLQACVLAIQLRFSLFSLSYFTLKATLLNAFFFGLDIDLAIRFNARTKSVAGIKVFLAVLFEGPLGLFSFGSRISFVVENNFVATFEMSFRLNFVGLTFR